MSGLGETWGVTEERSSRESEALPLMTATDAVRGIPSGGNRRVWELADGSWRCRSTESGLWGKLGFAGC